MFSWKKHKKNKKPVEKEAKVSVREQWQALGNLRPFFRMIWATSKTITLANISLRLLRSAVPLSMLYVGKLIIDQVIVLMNQGEGADTRQVLIWVGVELGLALLSEFINRILALLDGLLGDLFANHTSELLIRQAARLDLVQFEDATFYDKLERARKQTTGRTILMTQVLTQLQDLVTVLFLSVGLVAFNPWLLLILLVAIVPSFLGETHFNERSYSLSRSWTPERRELDYLRYIGASDETAKEVKIFGLSGFLAQRFRELAHRFYQQNQQLAIRRALWGSLWSGVGTLAYYGAYGFIVLETIAGVLSVGDLTFLAGSFNRMRNLLQGILTRFSRIADGALYLQDLFDFLAIEPEMPLPQVPQSVPQPIRKGFVFENVGFRYRNSDQWALRHVSFHLAAGEKLALVGENGAGKTTLVKLLSRLYEPSEGRILLDGVDLREYDPLELRQAIGVIFQDFVRFQLEAGENIAVGRIDRRTDLPTIERSAKKSLADSVIDRLPEGYEQRLGKRFANGVELSGGEWQKIALGRAYMREAQVLILDEPTSALDARAEYEVFQRFTELIEGKSAVLISHRFSTVRMADRILFLEQGQVLELGAHQELMELDGRYAELFRLQARGYQ